MDLPTSLIIKPYCLHASDGCVDFHYAFDHGVHFMETIHFGRPWPKEDTPAYKAIDRALQHLRVALGVSYYKAWLPSRIQVEGELPPSAVPFFKDFYSRGLAELGYRHSIDIRSRIHFDLDQLTEHAAVHVELPHKNAVLIGGGKDSLVSLETLKRANLPIVLLAVNPKAPILNCVVKSGLPCINIQRHIDPQLFTLNRQEGVYNGHVPITGLLSLIAIVAAFVHGFDTIVLSNERSANEGNIDVDGQNINHQYSKSWLFEHTFSEHIRRFISPDIHYFSLLRPFSSLRIAQWFARINTYDQVFVSCNQAYKIHHDQAEQRYRSRWCGNCPKCRFVFLSLATAMSKSRLVGIFGTHLLNDETQLSGYQALVGIGAHKPWECVGETLESAAALYRLSTLDDWRNSVVVRSLVPQLLRWNIDFETIYTVMQHPNTQHQVPFDYMKGLDQGDHG